MDKKLIGSIAGVAIIGLIGFSVLTTSSSGPNVSDKTAEQVVVETPQITVSEDGRTVSHDGQEGIAVLDTTRSLADVGTKDSDFGEFITSINGLSADANNEYWAFYVNGNLASEGAGTYKAVKGDRVEWKLEAF